MTGNASQQPAYEIWGLTGGIASGKSTAARIFSEYGVPVLDADQVSRELSSPGGQAYAAIVSRFGTANRMELRKLIFSDPSAKKDLEAILHPLIQAESLRQMEALAKLSKTHPLRVLYEASLLVETGRYRQFKGLIVIEAPPHVRQERIVRRDQVSAEFASQMIAGQITDEARRKAASFVIQNPGTEEELRQSIHQFLVNERWISS